MKPNAVKGSNKSVDIPENIVEMNQDFHFTYDLVAVGQASGSITSGEQSVEFSLVNNSSPLTDLLKGMINILFEPSHIWGEENISWIDWYGNDSSLKWVLSTNDGNTIHVKLIQCEDFFEESGKVVLETSLSLLDFYYEIIQSLDRLIKKLGLLNYEQRWQHDEFPFTYFILLKKHLIEKGHWVPTDEKLGTLNDELDFLLT